MIFGPKTTKSHYNIYSVEKVRITLTILLVVYHVIGLPTSGLHLNYPHPLRIFADLLGDFRMPAFAFIAGFVFALRPITLPQFGSFARRKLMRLAVPGLIAMLIFNAISGMLQLRWTVAPENLWQIAVLPYAHFWFLQALLSIFFVVGLIDVATRGRAELPLLGIALALSLAPIPLPGLFSINQAVRLAPFFLTGICYWRHREWIACHYRVITAAAVASVALWGALTVTEYKATGSIEIQGREFHALLLAVPLCTLLLFNPLPMPASRSLGQYTFTIYLYHVLATAGMRRLLLSLGFESVTLHVLLGVGAGLILPAMLHRALLGWRLGAWLILGIRPSGTRPGVRQLGTASQPIAGAVRTKSRSVTGNSLRFAARVGAAKKSSEVRRTLLRSGESERNGGREKN